MCTDCREVAAMTSGGRACCINTVRPEIHLCMHHMDENHPTFTQEKLHPQYCISELVLAAPHVLHVIPLPMGELLSSPLYIFSAQFGAHNNIVVSCLF